MALTRNPQVGFETRLRHIRTAGVDLPPEIDALRQRLKDFERTSGTPMRARLADAVTAGDPRADLSLLRAAALAEAAADPAALADIGEAVRLRINREIRAKYSVVALSVYGQLAARFDTAASKLAAAAAAVDVELDAAAAVAAPEKARKAWLDAEHAAAELNRLLTPLKAAAVLAEICDDTAENDLPLCVDPGQLHRRRVWEAWETDEREAAAARAARSDTAFTVDRTAAVSRTGRWGALLRIDATIRACPPEAFTPYRRPARLEERTIHQDGRNMKITVDPEDDDYQPEQPPKFTPPARVVVTR